MPNHLPTDEQLIQAIQASEAECDKALLQIVENWQENAETFIRSRGVKEHDAEDIFYIALLQFVNNIKGNKFQRNSSLLTYFTAICRYKCADYVRSLRKRLSITGSMPEGEGIFIKDPFDPDPQVSDEAWQQLFVLLTNKLGDGCRIVLTLEKLGYSPKEIADRMGLKQEQSARNKACECRKKLRELALADPKIMEIYNRLQ